MASSLLNTDGKIKKLPKIHQQKKWYPVQPNSSLYLVAYGKQKRFVGKWKIKPFDVPIGSYTKGMKVDEAISEWEKLKDWAKDKGVHPKKYYEPEEKPIKTLFEVANKYFDEVYRPKNKERTWKDRRNKLNQMLDYFGQDILITDLEIDKGGREMIETMLVKVFKNRGSHDQLIRCRQLLTRIFKYAEDYRFIGYRQNPVYNKFEWEGADHKKLDPKIKSFAHTITSKSWGKLPEFLKSINSNNAKGNQITNLATKAHLLMCIRTGVISHLEWSWFDAEENMWIIPAETPGLKRQKKKINQGIAEDHIIPSTTQINSLMNQVRSITGWQKYVFYSFNGKKDSHLGEETINDHLRNLGWKGQQSAHGWRDVITTSALEHSDIDYEIVDRQLGRMDHKQGTRGHYDQSTLIAKRRNFMEWWSKTLVDQGLKI